jgi:hypothetical protein
MNECQCLEVLWFSPPFFLGPTLETTRRMKRSPAAAAALMIVGKRETGI